MKFLNGMVPFSKMPWVSLLVALSISIKKGSASRSKLQPDPGNSKKVHLNSSSDLAAKEPSCVLLWVSSIFLYRRKFLCELWPCVPKIRRGALRSADTTPASPGRVTPSRGAPRTTTSPCAPPDRCASGMKRQPLFKPFAEVSKQFIRSDIRQS